MRTTVNTIYTMLASLVIACFTLAPARNALGVVPPPEGAYANGNTIGNYNTAIGLAALATNTTGRLSTSKSRAR
jgi:hypothetical protein